MTFIKTALKAVAAAVGAFLSGLTTALADSGANIGDLSDLQWVSIAGFTFASFVAVYGISNRPA